MPRSQAEVRLAHAVLEGRAKDAGMGRDYAQEVVRTMHGKKLSSLPDRVSPSQNSKAGARASQQLNKGNITPSEKARIDSKADQMLGKSQNSYAAGGVLDSLPAQREKIRSVTVNLGASSAGNTPSRLAAGEKLGSDPGPVPNRTGLRANPPMIEQGKDSFGRKFQPVSKHPTVPGKTGKANPLGNRRFLVPLLLLLCASAASLKAQQGTPVSVVRYPSGTAPAELFFYDGSNNVTYVCRARPDQPTTTYSGVTAVVVTGPPDVATLTFPSAHGMQPGNKLVITGSLTTNLNTTYAIVSVPSPTTLTLNTVSVAAASYSDFTAQTDAPLSSKPIWSIEHFVYGGSNVAVHQWAKGVAGNYTNICDNRATTSGPNAITYK